MKHIDFLNKQLNLEELSEFLTEIMNYTALEYEYPTRVPKAIILDEEGDIVDSEKYIGDKNIYIVRNVFLLKSKLDEERGYNNGKYDIQDSIKRALGIV